MIPQLLGLAIAGYLLGSIPIAWIMAKLVTGKDLRTLGSGTVGVMNVALSVTRSAGLLVFLGELFKGSQSESPCWPPLSGRVGWSGCALPAAGVIRSVWVR